MTKEVEEREEEEEKVSRDIPIFVHTKLLRTYPVEYDWEGEI